MLFAPLAVSTWEETTNKIDKKKTILYIKEGFIKLYIVFAMATINLLITQLIIS